MTLAGLDFSTQKSNPHGDDAPPFPGHPVKAPG